MTVIELKKYLKDNPDLIERILEDLGCDCINVKNDRITSCAVDGDNPTSVYIRLTDTLNCDIYTRSQYQSYEIKDIITLVQFFRGCTMPEALKYIRSICGISSSMTYEKLEESNTLKFLKTFKKSKSIVLESDDEVLDEEALDDFINGYSIDFLNDGIDKETQDIFGVMYDLVDNRTVFPIRNYIGELITIKGRTMNKKFIEYGVPKYIYYYNFTGKYYLYGEYENKDFIAQSSEVYVFEAEKSVQQAATIGHRNAVSISKKIISKQQVKRLLNMHKDVVIAFDKDVQLNDIFIECRKFKGMCNVYYILDKEGYLSKKQSPTDCGKFVFEELSKHYKFKYNGE